MAQKLLSIVVPTKNRYYYLKYLIRLIDSLHSDELELVIQDNSDDNSEFLDYLKEKSFDFIRYDYTKGQIPMSDNSDKAVLNSTGEYICFIGDDDGVTKYIINGVHWMKDNGIEAVKSASFNYCWPDAPQGRSADIVYRPFSGNVQYLNPFDELIKVLNDGVQNRGNMPLAYHSVVSRAAMNRIYAKCGTYFPGNSPDISNAVALSLVVKKFAIVDVPWAYSGNSAYKGGGVFARGNAAPQITDIPWFRPSPNKRWDKQIPRIAAGTMIWADSVLESLHNMGRDDLRSHFDFYRCYAKFLILNPQFGKQVYDVCENTCKLKIYLLAYKIVRIINAIGRRVGWALHIKPKDKKVSNVMNILEATSTLEKLSDGKMKNYECRK